MLILLLTFVIQFFRSADQLSCPTLGDIPASPPGCRWVVDQDWLGCRTYIQECLPAAPRPWCGNVNEILWRCSSKCEPTCTNRNPICDKSCGTPKCQCVGGYYRSQTGSCVKEDQCPAVSPPRCNMNEQFVTCSSLCEPTCANPNSACAAICGPPKCQCIPGSVRDSYGRCIPRNSCSWPVPPPCPPNEKYKQCSSLCEPTCYTPPDAPCPLGCGPPKCQCKEGYVRSNSGCIHKSHCFHRFV